LPRIFDTSIALKMTDVASNFIAKSSRPIAITIRFGSLVLSDEGYNQENSRK